VIRAGIYVLAAGVIWLAEGVLFSRLLGFSHVQVALVAVLYVALFGIAVLQLVRSAGRQPTGAGQLSPWRYISVAPMLVVVLGSFVSLPILLLIALIGKWIS
jgi:hypothetical protein